MELDWHLKSTEDVLQSLQTTREGLSDLEVEKRILEYGLNRVETSKRHSIWILFFNQFLNPLICILLGACVMKLVVSSFLDGAVLLITIFLMVLISFFQEVKAEKASQALKKLAAHKTRVCREGRVRMIPSEQLVPGDVILLEIGNRVPADARLIEVKNLKINESMLTGESVPSEKQIEKMSNHPTLADRKNMVYEGTVVVYGRGEAVTVATRMNTELGKIAKDIEEIQPQPTQLQKSIQSISKGILLIILGAILLFAAISFYQGMGLSEVFWLSITAAIAAIPEGLPIAFTAILATGMRLMAKNHVIIRKLIAVETLGATSTICADKTGTLTWNQMTLRRIQSFTKAIELDSQQGPVSLDPTLRQIFEIGVLCNDSLPSEKSDEILGDPTEGALLQGALAQGLSLDEIYQSFPRIGEIPFISENLYMATLHLAGENRKICVKGAPEKLFSLSSSILTSDGPKKLDDQMKLEFQKTLDEMTTKGLRLLAVGYLETGEKINALHEDAFREKLIFAGVFGMMDPPRKEAIYAVDLCKKAQIRVVMITGDHPLTAVSIAEQMGIITQGAISGKELEMMGDDELKKRIQRTSVFARVEPGHKLRIVRAFQACGDSVAMTGDGVNDAPALEAANIGISMGISGTDVAKEAADMILTNDRFDSIITAIEEGRAIFNRLRNVSFFLLSTCFGELLSLILSVFFTGLASLIPLQILWINLISGSLIAIPLGFEPKTGEEMKHPPRDPASSLLYPGMIYRIIFIAIFLGVSGFLIFFNTYSLFSLEKARTMVLSSVLVFEWFLALGIRSEKQKTRGFQNPWLLIAVAAAVALHICILYIPFISQFFYTTPLSMEEWLIVFIPTAGMFFIDFIRNRAFPDLFSKGRLYPVKR